MSEQTFSIVDDDVAIELEASEALGHADAARAAGRPVAIDAEERAAYLGISAEERGRQLLSLEAPDFALPDLDGRMHSLSEHRGRKVFLVAYGSW
jgi:hypothetical protein